MRDDTDFESELTALLNRFSKENDSNTRDFLLRNYIISCLMVYSEAVNARDSWYGVRLEPGVRLAKFVDVGELQPMKYPD